MTGQVIHADDRAVVSELAFSRYAMVTPHTNPNITLFIVISGGGFVQVGDERVRVNHGEAVVWPPDVPHGAYTDGTEMRVLIVELPDRPSPSRSSKGRLMRCRRRRTGSRCESTIGSGEHRDSNVIALTRRAARQHRPLLHSYPPRRSNRS